jgi:hypothetical protein
MVARVYRCFRRRPDSVMISRESTLGVKNHEKSMATCAKHLLMVERPATIRVRPSSRLQDGSLFLFLNPRYSRSQLNQESEHNNRFAETSSAPYMIGRACRLSSSDYDRLRPCAFRRSTETSAPPVAVASFCRASSLHSAFMFRVWLLSHALGS